MSIFLDVMVAGTIIIMMIRFYFEGLTKAILGLISGLLAIILALSFYKPLGALISDNITAPIIKSAIESQVSKDTDNKNGEDSGSSEAQNSNQNDNEEAGENSLDGVNKDNVLKNIPQEIKDILSTLGISTEELGEKIEEILNDTAIKTFEDFRKSLIDYIVNPISRFISNIIAFILIFILAKILLGILAKILDLVTKFPVIKQFNRLGGMIIGLVYGIIIVCILCAVINIVRVYIPADNKLAITDEKIESTIVYKHFNNFNFFNLFFKKSE